MSVGRTQLFAIAAAAALLSTAGQAQAAGGYAPCMVAPVFVQPLLSKPLFTLGEVIPPTLAKADSAKWIIEVPDFETPALVQPVVMQPRYDGCAEQADRRLIERASTLRTIEGKVLLAPPSSAALRIMKGVDACCGTAVGGGK